MIQGNKQAKSFPDGSGVVHILTDYCSALGNQTVESVRVLNSRDTPAPPTMYFVLADVASTPLDKTVAVAIPGKDSQITILAVEHYPLHLNRVNMNFANVPHVTTLQLGSSSV